MGKVVVVSFSPQYFESLEKNFEFWNDYTGKISYSKKIQADINRTIRILKSNVSAFPTVSNPEYLDASRCVKRAIILKNFSLYYEVTSEHSVTILFLRDNRRTPNFNV